MRESAYSGNGVPSFSRPFAPPRNAPRVQNAKQQGQLRPVMIVADREIQQANECPRRHPLISEEFHLPALPDSPIALCAECAFPFERRAISAPFSFPSLSPWENFPRKIRVRGGFLRKEASRTFVRGLLLAPVCLGPAVTRGQMVVHAISTSAPRAPKRHSARCTERSS